MKKNDKYLPIGTIVFVNNSIVMYMIVGYLNKDKSEKINDYIAIPFPYGLMATRMINTFDHKDINEIIFLGYENQEFQNLNNILNTKYKNKEHK